MSDSGHFGGLLRPQRNFFRPDIRVNGFQNQRDTIETVILHDPTKASWPILPSPAMVTVDAAAKSAFGIIQVHAAQILEADDPFEFGEGLFTLLRAA